MSMSQEEIEALMNGLDIADDEPAQEEASESTTVNTDEIEELISQSTEESKVEVSEAEELIDEIIASEETPVEEKKEELLVNEPSSGIINTDEIDDLLKDLEEGNSTDVSEPKSEDIESDDILAGIDGVVDNEVSNSNEAENLDLEPESFDSASIDTVEDVVSEVKAAEEVVTDSDTEEIMKDWTDSKINEGIFPLPADQDTKVVNQLSQVANDSEEKVGQIFDVLSLGLDNNNELRSKISNIESFIQSEEKLLNSLSTKFPNISVFSEHIAKMDEVNSNLTNIKNLMNEEDMKIFEAMELMQFNDINRQKIERVMSVIRKLSTYLNNLFEDDGSSSEIAVARHIHGDTTNDLIGDDLEKLIADFEK